MFGRAAKIWGRGVLREVLAIESDDLVVRATVLQRAAQGGPRVVAYAESRASGLAAAMEEIGRTLEGRGVRVPSEAVLLSAHVHTMLLDLPVDPRKTPPYRQMQELTRWEMEPYLLQDRSRRLGAILVGRGYVRDADLDRLLRDTTARTGGPDVPPQRLGERAVEAGLLTKEQLEEALVCQRSLQGGEGTVVCGWTSLGRTTADGKWVWLVAGMPEAVRRQAVEDLERRGIRLRGVYPLVGCAAAGLNGRAEGASAVFEYHGGFLSYTRLAGTRVVHSRHLFTRESGNPLHECLDLAEAEAEHVWLAGRWPDGESMRQELAGHLRRPCDVMTAEQTPWPVEWPEAVTLAGMRGAAAHVFAGAPEGGLVGIPAEDPLPSMGRDWRFRAGMVGASVAVVLAAVAMLFAMRGAEADARLQANRTLELARSGMKSLVEKQQTLAQAQRFLAEVLPARQGLVPRLLRAIETSCPDEVMIRRVAENAQGEIEVRGWGLSATAIREFTVRLQKQLGGWEVVDSGRSVYADRGWEGLEGYAFEVKLVGQKGGERL